MTSYAQFDTLEDRRLFAASFLDPAYGNAGLTSVKIRFAPGEAAETSIGASRTAVDSTGRVYVAVTTTSTLQIQRLTADGQIDTTWAVKQRNRMGFLRGDTQADALPRFEIDNSDRLLVMAGNTLYRFTPAGVLDNSFGDKGAVTMVDYDLNPNFTFDRSGRIIVVGRTKGGEMLVERLLAAGRLDRSFHQRGVLKIQLNSGDKVSDQQIRTLPDGQILVIASTLGRLGKTGAWAVRMNAEGVLDQNYNYTVANGAVPLVPNETSYGVFDGKYYIRDIRPSGVVDFTKVKNDGVTTSVEYGRITADGKLESVGGDTSAPISLAHPDGGELSVVNSVVRRIRPDGTFVSNFNGGKAIALVSDIDLGLDESVYVSAVTVKGGGRVSVAKYLPSIDPANA